MDTRNGFARKPGRAPPAVFCLFWPMAQGIDFLAIAAMPRKICPLLRTVGWGRGKQER